jgi:tRNA(Arg) A34 adenosine deaminase TadA
MSSRTKFELTAIIKNKKGKVLSIGKNRYLKTHPYQALCAAKVGLPEKIYLHAEIDSIIRCRDLSKAYSIHIFRYGSEGQPLLAKPCLVCSTAIAASGIKKIYHT